MFKYFVILSLFLIPYYARLPGLCAQEDMRIRTGLSSYMHSIQSNEQSAIDARSIHGMQINFIPPLNNKYFSVGIEYRRDFIFIEEDPIDKRKWGGGIRFSRFTDSRKDKDLGVALGSYVIQHIKNISSLSFLGKLGVDVDYVWRKDDEDRFVNALMLSVFPALNVEAMRSGNTAFVISAGYRFSILSEWQRPGKWVVTGSGETSETSPGMWHDEAPKININGFFLMIGLKLFIF